jgi:rare lipoprotein A
MRYLMPVALAAAALVPVAGTAQAKHAHHVPKRVAGHVSVHVNHHSLMTGHELVVRGRVRPLGTHRVKVVVRGRAGGVSGTSTARDGRFQVKFGLPSTGLYKVRAFAVHDRRIEGTGSVRRHFTVYRQAEASYYGPGLYGGALACGGTLEPGTLGVAHKTLPCGTMVRLRYHGQTITVPVVDRGPYVAGRDFDLTEATKAKLGFPSTGVVLSSR